MQKRASLDLARLVGYRWVGRLIHSLYGLTWEADILHIDSYRFSDPGKNPKFNIPPPSEAVVPETFLHHRAIWAEIA